MSEGYDGPSFPVEVPLFAQAFENPATARHYAERTRTSTLANRLIGLADIEGPTSFNLDADETESVKFLDKADSRLVFVIDQKDPETSEESTDESEDCPVNHCPTCEKDILETIVDAEGEFNFCPHCGEDISDVEIDRTRPGQFTPHTRNILMGYFQNDNLDAVCLLHEFRYHPLYSRGIKYGPLQEAETNTGDLRTERV
jgi:hypothetical protein